MTPSLSDVEPALCDEFALSMPDPFSISEERFVLVGRDALSRVLTIAYTHRGEHIRVISTRPATDAERRTYKERIRPQQGETRPGGVTLGTSRRPVDAKTLRRILREELEKTGSFRVRKGTGMSRQAFAANRILRGVAGAELKPVTRAFGVLD